MFLPSFLTGQRRALAVLALACCGVLGLACDPVNSFTPTVDNVAGNYVASTFTSVTGGTATDHLLTGASLTINLATNGTTSGHLFVPGGAPGGGDLDADMVGTWTLAGTSVTFAQTADTFVRDMSFTAQAERLVAEATFGGTTVRVVLDK